MPRDFAVEIFSWLNPMELVFLTEVSKGVQDLAKSKKVVVTSILTPLAVL